MCLASVYLKENGKSELLEENVAVIDISAGKVTLTTLFRETREIEAKINKIDFANSSVTLERVTKA